MNLRPPIWTFFLASSILDIIQPYWVSNTATYSWTPHGNLSSRISLKSYQVPRFTKSGEMKEETKSEESLM